MVHSEYFLKDLPQQKQLEGSPYPTFLRIDNDGTSFMLSDGITKMHPRGDNEKRLMFKLFLIVW